MIALILFVALVVYVTGDESGDPDHGEGLIVSILVSIAVGLLYLIHSAIIYYSKH